MRSRTIRQGQTAPWPLFQCTAHAPDMHLCIQSGQAISIVLYTYMEMDCATSTTIQQCVHSDTTVAPLKTAVLAALQYQAVTTA